MNKFGIERPERRRDGEERKTNREDIEDQLRGMNESTDVRGELREIRSRLANTKDLSREEVYRLQIRQAALLEYERAFELPRHKASSRVGDAPDIPALSPELEQKYPLHGAKYVRRPASETYIHESDEHAKRQRADIMKARQEAIRLRLGDTPTIETLHAEESRILKEIEALRIALDAATAKSDRERINASVSSLEGERVLIMDMIQDADRASASDGSDKTAVRRAPSQELAAK